MKFRFLTTFFLFFSVCFIFAQNLQTDYKVLNVNKQVSNITYSKPYASALENYIARIHLWINGEYSPIYSEMIDEIVRQSPRNKYSEKSAEKMLNSEIEQVVIYKDSIGFVFRKDKTDPDGYLVGTSVFENGKWLGNGEDICFANNIDETKQYVENKSVKALNRLRQ